MTALLWEIEVKDTGEIIPVVPVAESSSALCGICRTCKGFRGFSCTGKPAQVSVLVAAFSWSRRKEINELAKMLSPCPVHGREPCPSWDLLHLGLGVWAALGHHSQPRGTVGERGRFPETISCERRPEAAFSHAIPTKPAGLGLGFYLEQSLNSLSRDVQGQAEVLQLPGSFAADQAELWQCCTRLSNSFCSDTLHLCCDWLCKNKTKKGTSLL